MGFCALGRIGPQYPMLTLELEGDDRGQWGPVVNKPSVALAYRRRR